MNTISVFSLRRRSLLQAVALLGLFAATAEPLKALAADDPLPSWNDGLIKRSLIEFVQAVTDNSKPTFVPTEERIATFDQDGTLWVEHPIYSQVMYILDRVPAIVEAKPALKHVEPFKTVLSGDRKAIAHLPMADLENSRQQP